jgi:hypothetical protein
MGLHLSHSSSNIIWDIVPSPYRRLGLSLTISTNSAAGAMPGGSFLKSAPFEWKNQSVIWSK